MITTTPTPPPAPNSVWYQPSIRRVMRATPLSDGTVIAHDAELSDRMIPGVNPVSWRGTVDEFHAAFRPVDPDSVNFPKLAKCHETTEPPIPRKRVGRRDDRPFGRDGDCSPLPDHHQPAMSPKLTDENLRRRLLMESLTPPPRPALPWYERVLIAFCVCFAASFFAGLMWHLILLF